MPDGPAPTVPDIALNGGTTIPQVGFGVFEVSGDDTEASVAAALEAGYRSIDTATVYDNEAGRRPRDRDCGHPARRGVRHHEAVERRPGLRRDARGVRRASSGSASTTSTSTSSTGPSRLRPLRGQLARARALRDEGRAKCDRRQQLPVARTCSG